MLIDFHGAIRPATMTRTWPNLISTEGVRGLEQSKWSEYANPEHDVTLPFTRMFLGPMDYTPGAMVNAAQRSFARISRVLDAKMGDYVVVARRSGRDWYVGAMTDWSPRELTVDLSFLPAGTYGLLSFEDGINADRYGDDYRKTAGEATASTRLPVKMAPGGGFAAVLRPRP